MLIVRHCFLGITRFDDFHQRLGISRNILTDRRDHLVTRGGLDRVPYQQHLVRCDYRLTDKGRDLWLVLTAMRQWGDRWEADDGPPVVIEHKACDHQTTVVPTCSSCGAGLDVRSRRALPGPRLGQTSGRGVGTTHRRGIGEESPTMDVSPGSKLYYAMHSGTSTAAGHRQGPDSTEHGTDRLERPGGVVVKLRSELPTDRVHLVDLRWSGTPVTP